MTGILRGDVVSFAAHVRSKQGEVQGSSCNKQNRKAQILGLLREADKVGPASANR